MVSTLDYEVATNPVSKFCFSQMKRVQLHYGGPLPSGGGHGGGQALAQPQQKGIQRGGGAVHVELTLLAP
jgi:hypothetical protein